MMSASATMREYETIYVLRPDVDDKAAKEFMLKMKDLVSGQGGQNVKVSCWGRRRLAWLRDKQQRGLYVHHNYLGNPGVVKEYERMLGIDENVMLRQSILIKQNADASKYSEQQDELDPPIVKDVVRRETRDYGYDDGMGFDDVDFAM